MIAKIYRNIVPIGIRASIADWKKKKENRKVLKKIKGGVILIRRNANIC